MHLCLISPEKKHFVGSVDMVVLPGVKGDFGILDQHAPFMTILREGTVTLYEKGKKIQVFSITGGFCDITPEGCVVLADSVG